VLRIGLGTFALSLALSACAPQIALPQGDSIRIGAPISLTGSQAQAGQMVDEGYQFCQDWVNAQGGIRIGGVWHHLDVVREDDQSRVSLSAAITSRMVTQDGFKLLLGPSSNATTAKDAQIADAHGIPMVEGAGPSDSIFAGGYHWIFGVQAPASRQMQGVIDLALAHWAAPHSIAIIYADDSLSTEMAAEARDYAQSRGLSLAYFDNFAAGSNNPSPQIGAALSAQPDLLLETGELRDSVQTMQSLRGFKPQTQMIGFSEGPGTDGFIGSLQRAAENVVGTSQWVPSARTPVSYFIGSQDYAAQYQSRFGHPPNAQSAAATAACLALQVAIQRAASTDANRVRTALTRLDLNTFFGRIKFDERGANTAKTVYVIQVERGKPAVVWPAEAATALPRYPWPGWVK
jgi:branched-chain amino acid transport system substrate-binding protein